MCEPPFDSMAARHCLQGMRCAAHCTCAPLMCAWQIAYLLLGIEEVLNLPPPRELRLLVSPPDLLPDVVPELLAPVAELDLSVVALPPTSPADRPTDTIWSGEVLYGLLNLSLDPCTQHESSPVKNNLAV